MVHIAVARAAIFRPIVSSNLLTYNEKALDATELDDIIIFHNLLVRLSVRFLNENV